MVLAATGDDVGQRGELGIRRRDRFPGLPRGHHPAGRHVDLGAASLRSVGSGDRGVGGVGGRSRGVASGDRRGGRGRGRGFCRFHWNMAGGTVGGTMGIGRLISWTRPGVEPVGRHPAEELRPANVVGMHVTTELVQVEPAARAAAGASGKPATMASSVT